MDNNIALFEYHDEPLAPSYQFSNKLDDKTIHEYNKQYRRCGDRRAGHPYLR